MHPENVPAAWEAQESSRNEMVKTYTIDGKRLTVTQIAQTYEVNLSSLRGKLKRGYGIEESVKTLQEARRKKVKKGTFKQKCETKRRIQDCLNCPYPDCILPDIEKIMDREEKKVGRPKKVRRPRDEPEGWESGQIFITLNRNTGTIGDYAKAYGISVNILHHRLFTLGWDIEKAISEPPERSFAVGIGERGGEYTSRQVADIAGITVASAYKRIQRGLTGEELLKKGSTAEKIKLYMGRTPRTLKEIAEITGIPLQTVKNRYNRGYGIARITDNHCVKTDCGDCKAAKCRGRTTTDENSYW